MCVCVCARARSCVRHAHKRGELKKLHQNGAVGQDALNALPISRLVGQKSVIRWNVSSYSHSFINCHHGKTKNFSVSCQRL